MSRKVAPDWYGPAYGHFSQPAWDRAVENTREVLIGWAKKGKVHKVRSADCSETLQSPSGWKTDRSYRRSSSIKKKGFRAPVSSVCASSY